MTAALILAAGQGTRLRPITDDKPKCLVPLFGESLLSRQVNTLHSANIRSIHIATGYRSDQIKSLGYETSHNPNYSKTNMVESLFCAKEYLEQCSALGEDLIISYGDIVYQKENLMLLLNSEDDISLMIDKGWEKLWRLRLDNPLDDAETLVFDRNRFVKELGKKPNDYGKIQGQYTGLIKVRGDKIRDLIYFYDQMDRTRTYDGQDFENMYMTSFLQLLIDNDWPVKAVTVDGGWLEVDSVDDLNIYNRLYERGELSSFYQDEGK